MIKIEPTTWAAIDCSEILTGTLTMADGESINLQEDITFTGATTENLIKMPDNLLDALSIQEGSNKYITFDTVNEEEDIFFYKSVDILHTSTHADDHALEIDTDAAAYGDVKAVDIDYITGQIDTGQDEGIILVNIDETIADGGDVFGLEVLSTDGSANIYGMKVGAVVNPIHQDSGTFTTPTKGTDNTIGSSVTGTTIGFTQSPDTITDSNNGFGGFVIGELVVVTGATTGANNTTYTITAVAANALTVTPQPNTVEDDGATITVEGNVPAMFDDSSGTTTDIFENNGEYILIGAAAVFEEIEFIVTTSASGAGIKPTFWYSTAGSHQFTQFTPVDGTDGFKHTGIVAWDASDLSSHAVNTDTSTYDIKVIRTRSNLTTSPVLGYAKVAATTKYEWDKSGDVNIRNLTTSGTLGVTGTVTIPTALTGVIRADSGVLSVDSTADDKKVKVDSGATADYIGAAYSDGILRVTQNELTYTDGGNFITLGLADHNTARTALGLAIGTDVLAYSATVIYDADFGSAGLCATDGAGTYSIVANASANWNTAFGWGDHSGANSDITSLSGITGTIATPTGITMSNGGTIGQADGVLMTFDDTGNTLLIAGCNVGIGITPAQKLHIYAATGDVRCRVESNAANTAAKFQLIGNSADNSVLELGDEDLDNVGTVQYSHGTDSMRFSTADTLGMTLNNAQALAVVGCVTDGTCEIMKSKNAIAIIDEVLNTGTGILDEHGHEKWDMKKIYKKYPFLVHKGRYKKTSNDDTPEVDKYYDKLGAKGDLAYAAIIQLNEKIISLEKEIKILRR